MEAHTQPVAVDQNELYRARKGWHNFTKFATFGVIHIVVLLLLMAFFLI